MWGIEAIHWLGPLLLAVGLASIGWGLWSGSPNGWRIGLASAAAGAAVLGLDAWIETPREQVRSVLEQMARAAEAGDAEIICGFISDAYQDGRHNAEALRSVVRRRIGDAQIEHVGFAGLEFETLSEDLEARFVAHVQGREGGGQQRPSQGSYPVRLRIRFAASPSGWRVVAIHRFDIIQAAKEIPLDSVL